MTPAELLSLYRDKTMDTSTPPLVSDEEVLEFLDEAQTEAARRAHLLVDSTSDASEAVVTATEPMVEISDALLHLRRVRLGSNMMPLRRMSVRDMDQQMPGWEGTTQPSTPLFFIPDYETGYIRLYPPPLSADTLKMTAVRVPLKRITALDSKLEIPAKYHRGLLDWMLFRGYSKADPEVLDDTKAKKHEALFEREFGEKSSAVDERWAFEQYQDIGEV